MTLPCWNVCRCVDIWLTPTGRTTSVLVLCARKVPHRTQRTQDASVPVRSRAGIIHSHSTTGVGSRNGVSVLKISAWKNNTETASKIRTFLHRFWRVAADFDPDCPYFNGANPCIGCLTRNLRGFRWDLSFFYFFIFFYYVNYTADFLFK